MIKPREFWISKHLVTRKWVINSEKPNSFWLAYNFHVIEYEAYENLINKYSTLADKYSDLTDKYIKTKAALERAVEALELISIWPIDSERVAEPRMANQALAEIKELLDAK